MFKDKRRDMARSVLPSTSRKSSRFYKRNQHKMVRSRVRNLIHDENWDDEADLALDAQRHRRYQGIKEVVFERRGADKVGPLMRWAEAKASEFGDTPQERYAALRAMLPPNLVGSHAMSHVAYLDAYDTNPYRYRFGTYESKRFAKERDEKIDLLVEALNGRHDGHGELNRRLKAVGSDRLWHGTHDTVEFITWIMQQPQNRVRCGEKGGDNGFGWSWQSVSVRVIVAKFCGFDEHF